MNRVATGPVQYSMKTAMQTAQQRLANSLHQLETQKKATDYAGIGIDTSRLLSARSVLARQEAHKTVASHVSTTLEYYDTGLNAIDTQTEDLRKALLEVIGTGNGPGLQADIESNFDSLRATLNTVSAGNAIFAGSQTNTKPFIPQQLSDMVGLASADAFANDQILRSAQMADGVNVEFGIVASDVAGNLVKAYRTLAEAGPFGDKPTAVQLDAMKQAISELEIGLKDIRSNNAHNGAKQNQVETLGLRADERALMLEKVIGDAEDADMGQVALDIENNRAILTASYSVFAQISGLSLANYLR
ncbi:flagellin [Sphingobium boeckii]|uniref:Flagellar hook-associated protein 3 FlgL n=1 Tax=Sphingobium boeckii TaxID=1082345 RepID=A0A7W9AGI8_9SPHN|nr:flagellin [Sphingobium boeckii]MBB5685252.1 flagellar hook-associated protein 3 FlgL [Sphingobium boeckii]